jgi:hypothetical protein
LYRPSLARQGSTWIYNDEFGLYCDREKRIPIRFQVSKQAGLPQDATVRAYVAFANEEYRNEPVKRCKNHEADCMF